MTTIHMSYKEFRKCLISVIFLLSTLQIVNAGSGDVDFLDTYTNGNYSIVNHLSDGYFTVTYPIYEADGSDEALDPATHKSYLSLVIGGTEYKCFWIYSMSSHDSWQSEGSTYWAKVMKSTSGAVKVFASTSSGSKDIPSNYYKYCTFSASNGNKNCSGSFNIYINPSLMSSKQGQSVSCKFALWADVNGDSDGSFWITKTKTVGTLPSFSAPTIQTPDLNPSVGNYSVTFSSTGAKDGSTYNWDSDDTTTGKNGTTTFPISDYFQQHTLYFNYKVSSYQTITRSKTQDFKAFQQARSFKATNSANGNTHLSWTTVSSKPQQTDDFFEIIRSTDKGFATYKTVGRIKYGEGNSIDDNTGADNLNCTVYYRIRRTLPSTWNWAYYQETNIEKSMYHKGIKDESVSEDIDENNLVTITWDFDNGNVVSDNSKIIIKRTRLDNQKVDLIEIPFNTNTKSYNEELTAICKEFHYSVYVKPGNTNYSTQSPVEAIAKQPIVPVNFGNISALKASKGYFSNRVELEWNLVEGGAETFSIQRRLYGSTEDFKQLDTKPAFESSREYSYTDVTCTPGVIYEYRIAGMTSCATGLSTVYSPPTVGFRTPSGDIYGRVTFDGGQAEEGVEINVTTEENILSQSLYFADTAYAYISNENLLTQNIDSITIQAYVSTKSTEGVIVSKDGMYTLGIKDNKYYFSAGDLSVNINNDTLSVSVLKSKSDWVHLTGVYNGDKLLIYLNGDSIAETIGSATITGNDNYTMLGSDHFAGRIDELRIWSCPLSAEVISRDYNRYLTGGESKLLAYYTFNYATQSEFYDISYSGTTFNANHGILIGTEISTRIPSPAQLGYKGITRSDGSYEVRSIPYFGNGTAYYLVPKLGIHQFESEKEVRFISAQAQSHTVDFIDKSSFTVKGFISYSNSTIPVEGVNFSVDGKTVVQSNGIPETTAADGSFSINVPVGVHEVKAVKINHVFENNGEITDQYGVELNYQENKSNILLKDKTTIKYVGRVGGGTIQSDYPLGHSLSKNNLATNIKVILTHTKTETLVFDDSTMVEKHFKPSNKDKALSNKVQYTGNQVIINVNDTTGEFVAHIIPEKFTVKVNAGTHHSNIPGSGSTIDLTQQFIELKDIYQYEDSVLEDDTWKHKNYSDTVLYNFSQKFIKRYEPIISVNQIANGEALTYFGSDSVEIPSMVEETAHIPLYDYDAHTYTFDKPVFLQNTTYQLKLNVFEQYVQFDGNDTLSIDKVPTQDAVFMFNNDLTLGDAKTAEIQADSMGSALYSFEVTEPEMTTAISSINLKVTIGKSSNPTSIDWVHPASFPNGEAFILGAHQTGTDFVTAGPDNVLTVLHDPPGSNSYSYLEKGVSFSESSAYTGSISNSGTEDWTLGMKAKIVTFAGVGAGVIQEVLETTSEETVGITHEEQYEWQYGKQRTTTTTTRFQTSDDPAYVGANADLYIGYSTNITFGSTQNVTIVPRSDLDSYTGQHYSVKNDWAIVYAEGRSISKSFNTLFAYPQMHIENVLIPKFRTIRDDILKQTWGISKAALQDSADAQQKAFYVSYLDLDDPNFGCSNEDDKLDVNSAGDPTDFTDGPSYQIIYPNDPNYSESDTIAYLNQSIESWIERMKENEEKKVNAELLQNYSFHGGSNVEYSESYSNAMTHERNFYINIGGKISSDSYLGTGNAKTKFAFSEEINTQHGGTWNSETEASHTKGFVLAEEGTDYLSVDVCYEKGWDEYDEMYDKDRDLGAVEEGDLKTKSYYPSFIFKTMAGATSCPYEGAYVSKYFEAGQHVINIATKRVEVPEIDMETKFVENIPSGEPAQLTLFLKNNSETNDDAWYDLRIIDETNPDGAKFSIDGGAIGNGRSFLVPAGETLVKTLEVTKGRVLNYDDLQLVLQSQCQFDPTDSQEDIVDTVTFTVHFIPSCTNVNISKPNDNWIYNTKLPTVEVNGVDKHYMEVQIDEFNVNYDNFGRIELQYKSMAQSDDEWTTLISYFNDTSLYQDAIRNGLNAEMIKASDAGSIHYNFIMDDLPDQKYDLRAISICLINNEEILNISETNSGLKDMYCPRLFGSAEPADGILDIEDEVRLNFNETISDGLLTHNNFQVRGVRNGTISDHSTSVRFDGLNNYMDTEFEKNLQGKTLTVEMWIQPDKLQNATLFSHGNVNETMEMRLTADECMEVKIGNTTVKSSKLGQTSANPNYADGSWAHVAYVYNAEKNTISAYYNFEEVVSDAPVASEYTGIGNFVLGKSISKDGANYAGKMHNVRVWEKTVNETNLQLNSLLQLAGIEKGLLAYYPMNEGKGTLCEDKARGVNMTMHGTVWAMPDGFAVHTNGSNFLKIGASTAAITKEMDFTIEFWFKAEAAQSNACILSAGSGESGSLNSDYSFTIGFDENGTLSFTNQNLKTSLDGEYRDNTWHHFAIAVNRTIDRGQIYIDGTLSTFIDGNNIGGISTDYIYLGARGWYEENDADTLIMDHFFKGFVDDVRFWDLYRNENIINENNNVRLSGEELGLLHYYPFDTYIEYQGQKYVDFTNKDKHIAQGPNPETDEFSIINATINDVKTKDIAPIKDSGPVEDLDFDFVVNDDALIITLNEEEYKIAKTIITFTIFDVRDANGNSIVSPVTWSAYIDRNQLRWETDRIDLSQPVYESQVFTVKVMNNSGTVRNYTINNMPSWLEVNPHKGSLDPKSYETITFTVNQGLNIGSYNEVIYLTNDDNVSEALDINITVLGEKPDWNVDPANYLYNMSVYGKMRFNNIFSADKEDMLAVFSNGQCIGLSTSSYNNNLDMWYALMTIYSNEKKLSDIEFRMWDASTGITYEAVPSDSIRFANDAIIGSPKKPILFDAKEILYQDIALNKGWTWISFNLDNANLSDLNKTLANGTWTSTDIVKSFDDFDSYSKMKATWKGTLTNHGGLNNTSMFMVHSDIPQTLSVSGAKLDIHNTPLTIRANQWTFISYLPLENLPLSRALAGYDAEDGDVIKSQTGFAMAYGNNWVGNLSFMEPNKGYMLFNKSKEEKTLIYPTSSSIALRSAIINDTRIPSVNNFASFTGNMSVIAKQSSTSTLKDTIYALVNGEPRGKVSKVYVKGEKLLFISVSGDPTDQEVRFSIMRNGTVLETAKTTLPYTSNAIYGSIDKPIMLSFDETIDPISIYPSPFSTELNMAIHSSYKGDFSFQIIDAHGKVIYQSYEQTLLKDNYTKTINTNDFLPGIYIVKINMGDVVETKIVTKH